MDKLFEDIDFDKLMKPKPDWIISGKTYGNREELISWGCFYNGDKTWTLEASDEGSIEFERISQIKGINITKSRSRK